MLRIGARGVSTCSQRFLFRYFSFMGSGDLETLVRPILQSSDLDTFTLGSLLKTLEEQHGRDFRPQKQEILNLVSKFLQEHDSDADGDEKESLKKRKTKTMLQTAPRQKKPKRENAFEKMFVKLSPKMSEFMGGAEECSRADISRRLMEHVNQHNLFDPKDRRFILCDSELKALCGGEERIRLFSAFKHFKDHVSSKNPSVPRTKSDTKWIFSDDLKDFLGGEETIARTQIVKKLWEYIREHNLQDPRQKKLICCDATLEKLFKRKTVDCFGMNKLLSNHIRKVEE